MEEYYVVVVKKLISALMSMALIMSLCMGSVVFADDTTIDSTKREALLYTSMT